MTNWGYICNGKNLEGIGFCRNFAPETKIKKDMRNMSPTTISNLQLACHYWERARRQDSRLAAAAYYNIPCRTSSRTYVSGLNTDG